jgi:hypothetical protein
MVGSVEIGVGAFDQASPRVQFFGTGGSGRVGGGPGQGGRLIMAGIAGMFRSVCGFG